MILPYKCGLVLYFASNSIFPLHVQKSCETVNAHSSSSTLSTLLAGDESRVYDDDDLVAMEVSRVSRDSEVMVPIVDVSSLHGITGMRSIWRPTRLGMYTYWGDGDDIIVVVG
jgi:hypothetical protein